MLSSYSINLEKNAMKTICFSSILGMILVTAGSALGQESTNVPARGFVSVSVRAGQWALLANPLRLPTNTLGQVLPDVPSGTQVFKFIATNQSFREYTKQADGTWTGEGAESATLEVGEGFFLKNNQSQALAIAFNGFVAQGTLTTEIPAGFSLLASKVPQEGGLETDLGLPARTGAKAFLFRNGSYVPYTRRATSWTGIDGEPRLNVAEGFYYYSPIAVTWTRVFSINH
jgi:hypothetical protein